jgi:hypothetical protein
MTDPRALAQGFDLKRLDASFLDDPYPVYRALRDHDPVHRMPDGSYFLSRYDDCAAVYRDLVVALLRADSVSAAFEVADAARGRVLIDHLAAAQRDIGRERTDARRAAAAERLLRRIPPEPSGRDHRVEQREAQRCPHAADEGAA